MTRRRRARAPVEDSDHPQDLCGRCQALGKFCNKTFVAGKTPYQGKKRCFGKYKCLTCRKTWSSACSWANFAQKCTTCKIDVYPFEQTPLEKSQDQGGDPDKHHQVDLCGKCRTIGTSCIKGSGNGKGRRRRHRGIAAA